jgi:hypothetical protein
MTRNCSSERRGLGARCEQDCASEALHNPHQHPKETHNGPWVGRRLTHAKCASPEQPFQNNSRSGLSRSINTGDAPRKRFLTQHTHITRYDTDCPYAKHREHWEHAKGRGGFSNETDDGWINSSLSSLIIIIMMADLLAARQGGVKEKM